jgi:hypothetical protein
MIPDRNPPQAVIFGYFPALEHPIMGTMSFPVWMPKSSDVFCQFPVPVLGLGIDRKGRLFTFRSGTVGHCRTRLLSPPAAGVKHPSVLQIRPAER